MLAPADGTFAVREAPSRHRKYVKSSLENEAVARTRDDGSLHGFRKGKRKVGKPSRHDAFRQREGHPIRRTADDFDFDSDAPVEFANPYDNMHAGWTVAVTDTISRAPTVGYRRVFAAVLSTTTNQISPVEYVQVTRLHYFAAEFSIVLLNGVDIQTSSAAWGAGARAKTPVRIARRARRRRPDRAAAESGSMRTSRRLAILSVESLQNKFWIEIGHWRFSLFLQMR